MINRVNLIGRLTRDPELNVTNNGHTVCNFNLAVQRRYSKGEEETKADFINITTWGRQAEICNQHLCKGRLVGVDGQLRVNHYTIECDCGTEHIKRTEEVTANQVEFLGAPKNKEESKQAANN
ncbi:single-stranded DNA-binding protein [Halanaerobacter jeridensis]|uniref:Single-stranded DNA-binding protein n=1 Tax=Halanaerobacter jeridensis TaxID=706427 RepID=A0A938XW74_9FIRM|nr:single-stranded DNA-binding protein [Halanaerobacter jeridensis]MBM7556395.1 single-strand DNA-binding protein [Halanaerobacter jeridensis]